MKFAYSPMDKDIGLRIREFKDMRIENLQGKLNRIFGENRIKVTEDEDAIRLSGELDSWQDIVNACTLCVQKHEKILLPLDSFRPEGIDSNDHFHGFKDQKKSKEYMMKPKHVVNDIRLKDSPADIPMRIPELKDESLEGERPDVLIIGGGISGVTIARELVRWKLKVLLVEKESDLALHASGRNDGEVHPGIDLGKGSLKQHYVVKGNEYMEKVCKELNVPFNRCGQVVGFFDKKLRPIISAYVAERRILNGITGAKIISPKKIEELEPNLNHDFAFGLYNPTAATVCPYCLTIAYGENAVENGAKVSLNTAVLGMRIVDREILEVSTNRGHISPKLVINAAGVFAEDIAKMAEDRFFSIHPRRGTNSIVDRKKGYLVKSIGSWKGLHSHENNSKGGGILHTVSDNLLVGPDAVETREKENFETSRESIENVFTKHRLTAPNLSQRDIITYFTGVRAATFEEDYIIEAGRNTHNIVHVAGIQSPGLTTAPVVAIDVAKLAVKMLENRCFVEKTAKMSGEGVRVSTKENLIEQNENFNPIRNGIPSPKYMSLNERDKLIREHPEFGEIICRCEEISKGEILAAIRSSISVPTIDGIKKRVRPGMGRCQGGFCMPLVAKIISEELNIPLEDVLRTNTRSRITFGRTKKPVEEISQRDGLDALPEDLGVSSSDGNISSKGINVHKNINSQYAISHETVVDVLVIGGGPAGLSAAISADEEGARVLLVEREDRLGGILKQCIHDGFGLVKFGEKLTGPEYGDRFIKTLIDKGIHYLTKTFVTKIEGTGDDLFRIHMITTGGIKTVETKTIVLSTGCRERTAKQVAIHGTRPSGVFTAGTAQHLVNLLGQMPTKRCVILGSGDIGLIMARRLTLEGAEVLGVYEIKPEPSGLTRNISQCLEDYDIPLYLSHTVTRVMGHDRVKGVEIAKVDQDMNPIPGTEIKVECDALILSVGLIPENEIAEEVGVTLDSKTGGPRVDENLMTDVPGVFSCGNSLHVYDLVDYVSDSGELAGKNAARFALGRRMQSEKSINTRGTRRNEKEKAYGGATSGVERNTEIIPQVKMLNSDGFINRGVSFREMTCIVCPNSCKLKVWHKPVEPGEEKLPIRTVSKTKTESQFKSELQIKSDSPRKSESPIRVEGNKCPRGVKFAIEELTSPKRSISSTVATCFVDMPVVPVKTSIDIPKERIFDVMREINSTRIDREMKAGDVVIPNVLGLGADVVLTRDISRGGAM